MLQQGPHTSVVRRRFPLCARRLCRPLLAHWPAFAAVSSLRPGCSGGGLFFVPSPPPSVLPWSTLGCCGPSRGFFLQGHLGHSGGAGALCRIDSPAHSVVAPPRVFPPLRRPCGPPPRPPLQGTCVPLWRPRGPCCRPALPRFCRPYFSAGLPFLSLRRPCPMAALRSRLVGGRRVGFPSVALAGPHTPMYRSRAAILHAPWRRCQCLPSPLCPPHIHLLFFRLQSL